MTNDDVLAAGALFPTVGIWASVGGFPAALLVDAQAQAAGDGLP